MEDKRKIRVLRIINRFNIGGPTYNATFLTRYMSDDFETLLVGGLPEEGEKDSLHITEKYGLEPLILSEMQRDPGLSSDRKAYKRIKQLIKEFRPDIVHTHASKAGALGRRAAFACKVPVVVHTFHGHVFHSYFGQLRTIIYKTIERRLARRSSGIIAVSELQRKELTTVHKICDPEKIRVIPLGFDLQSFNTERSKSRNAMRTELGLAEDEVAIAIIGRLVPVKDHAFFLAAIEKLMDKTSVPVRVFIVGDGTERNWIAQEVERINNRFGERILMTSWITEIAKFNAAMDVICLTSKNEGTPVSLIEAQASGVPVLTTDVGGVRDVVLEHETGFIVDVGDLENYVIKLEILVEDEKKRTKMSQNGWNFVRDKFHYTRLVSDMEAYYRELLENKGLK